VIHPDQLRQLANWLLLRSVGEHDYQTTLTMLDRKVKALRKLPGPRATIGPRATPDTSSESSPRSSSTEAGT
jgi:hypothetical protein